jgi:hypothetical protein
MIRKGWSYKEDRRLSELAGSGKTLEQIAKAMDRTPDFVRNRSIRLGRPQSTAPARDLREIHAIRRRSVRLMADKGWQRKFEDPIPLPKGRQLVTLKDAADLITGLPMKSGTGMASCDRGPAAGRRDRRAHDARPHRCHEGIEPRPRPRVYRVREKASLGAPQAQEGPMKTYFFMVLAGLIACAIAGLIFMEMKQQISPD